MPTYRNNPMLTDGEAQLISSGAVTGVARVQNIGQFAVFVVPTVGNNPPASAAGGVLLAPYIGIKGTMAEMFDDTPGADHLFAFGPGQLSVSHEVGA